MRVYSDEDLVDMYQDELLRIVHTTFEQNDSIKIFKRNQNAEINVLTDFDYDDLLKVIEGWEFEEN